jgi:hypothetical protein
MMQQASRVLQVQRDHELALVQQVQMASPPQLVHQPQQVQLVPAVSPQQLVHQQQLAQPVWRQLLVLQMRALPFWPQLFSQELFWQQFSSQGQQSRHHLLHQRQLSSLQLSWRAPFS